MSRAVALIAVVQITVIVAGIFALGVHMKWLGYPGNDQIVWNPLAIFLRERCIFLFVIPIAWTAYATATMNIDRGLLSYKAACTTGILAIVSLFACFLYFTIFPFSYVRWPF